jgi:hypothetical protein
MATLSPSHPAHPFAPVTPRPLCVADEKGAVQPPPLPAPISSPVAAPRPLHRPCPTSSLRHRHHHHPRHPPLPVVACCRYRSPRYQDYPTVAAAVAAVVGGNDTIQFTIPEGLGALRSVSVLVRAGSAGSVSNAVVSNVMLFSYDDPVISFVELRTLDDDVLSQLSSPPTPGSVILSAHGFNFGPAASVFNDAVNRTLLVKPTSPSGAPLQGASYSTANVIPVRGPLLVPPPFFPLPNGFGWGGGGSLRLGRLLALTLRAVCPGAPAACARPPSLESLRYVCVPSGVLGPRRGRCVDLISIWGGACDVCVRGGWLGREPPPPPLYPRSV